MDAFIRDILTQAGAGGEAAFKSEFCPSLTASAYKDPNTNI